jgi:hypothetical protein
VGRGVGQAPTGKSERARLPTVLFQVGYGCSRDWPGSSGCTVNIMQPEQNSKLYRSYALHEDRSNGNPCAGHLLRARLVLAARTRAARRDCAQALRGVWRRAPARSARQAQLRLLDVRDRRRCGCALLLSNQSLGSVTPEGAPDLFKTGKLPERGDQVLRDPVGEVLLARLAAFASGR